MPIRPGSSTNFFADFGSVGLAVRVALLLEWCGRVVRTLAHHQTPLFRERINICPPPIRTVQIADRQVVFSKGGTAPSQSEIFVFDSGAMMEVATLLDAVRATVRVENADGDNFENRMVFQLSNDGESWDSPIVMDAGWSNGLTKIRTTEWKKENNFKRAIRFGVEVQQKTGVDRVVMARVSVVIDLKLVS